jgi:serine phosphatase RsbU (regulator of sigma subunit)
LNDKSAIHKPLYGRHYETMVTNFWIESTPVNGLECCGDFATCVDLEPGRRAIIVGDIAGRGTAAGDGASALCAYVHRLVARHVPLAETLQAASDFFIRTVMDDATPFASLFIAVADLQQGLIRYASAGHEPALLFNDGEASTHEHFDPTGPVLGLGTGSAFGEHTFPLFRDSFLVVVTDGITEARRSIGDRLSFFGTGGVARAVRDAVLQRRDPAREVHLAAMHHADGQLSDDACVVVSPVSFPNRIRLRPGARSPKRGAAHRTMHGRDDVRELLAARALTDTFPNSVP